LLAVVGPHRRQPRRAIVERHWDQANHDVNLHSKTTTDLAPWKVRRSRNNRCTVGTYTYYQLLE
jgi:hypothetical protein